MAYFELVLHEGMEFPVEVFIQESNENGLDGGEHWHDCFEFQFVLAGEAQQIVNGISCMAAEKSLSLILSGDIHTLRCKAGSGTRILILKFMPSMLSQGKKLYKYVRYMDAFRSSREILPQLTEEQKREVEALFTDIAGEMERKESGYELMVKGDIFRLMGFLQREKILSLRDNGEWQEQPEEMEKVLRYLEDNYDRDVTLREVAQELHLNYSYTSRYFKKVTGRNYKEYMDFIRVTQVNRLLAEGGKSITEISIACGFSGPQAMNRVYTRVTGISPSVMRRIYQGGGHAAASEME